MPGLARLDARWIIHQVIIRGMERLCRLPRIRLSKTPIGPIRHSCDAFFLTNKQCFARYRTSGKHTPPSPQQSGCTSAGITRNDSAENFIHARRGGMVEISIVIPIRDEIDSIAGLADELERVMTGMNTAWECIWIDDGSTDGSLQVLETLASAHEAHHYISFAQNAGQSAALFEGFRAARGDIIVTLDGDGQNDPRDIPKLIRLLNSNPVDLVHGYRQKRRDNLVRQLASRIANGFRNLTTGRTVRDVGCSTRAFRKFCVDLLPPFKGMHRFLPTLIALHGYRCMEVPVNHRPRRFGKTKYGINNRLWVGLFDIVGVFWFRKRSIHYRVARRSRPIPKSVRD
jgi:dolichol-phosphate mannosyltransferase